MATETEIAARYGQIVSTLRRMAFLPANAHPQFVSVVCNRCGSIVFADTLAELIPALSEWSIGTFLGDDDFCPNCRKT